MAHTTKAEKYLSQRDPELAALIKAYGPCELAPDMDGDLFAHLARTITFQQLSSKAAAAIYGRLCLLFPDGTPTASVVSGLSDEQLHGAGLSRQKMASIRALAEHFADRTLSLADLASWDDQAIIDDLTQVRGVGRWTVEMLLMFRLGRLDVLPTADLGVQRGAQLAYGLESKPTPKQLEALGEKWRPYRSVASWYLWRTSDVGKQV